MENKPKGIIRRIIIYTILLVLLFFAILGGAWSYNNIIKPSVLSAKHSCGIISDSELRDVGYTTTGMIIYNASNYSDQAIVVCYGDEESEDYKGTLRHEKIHLQQLEADRLNDCDSIFFLYLDEIEAKIMQRFSEDTLDFIYRTDDFTL